MSNRDVEKSLSAKEFITKLRWLADALEQGERFALVIAGERVVIPDGAAFSIEKRPSPKGLQLIAPVFRPG